MSAGVPSSTGVNRENREGRISVSSVAFCSVPSSHRAARRLPCPVARLHQTARPLNRTAAFLNRVVGWLNCPMLVAGKPELREYKAVFVVGDQEVSQFSDEITVNCAPQV